MIKDMFNIKGILLFILATVPLHVAIYLMDSEGFKEMMLLMYLLICAIGAQALSAFMCWSS